MDEQTCQNSYDSCVTFSLAFFDSKTEAQIPFTEHHSYEGLLMSRASSCAFLAWPVGLA